jgi:hypothetical protein
MKRLSERDYREQFGIDPENKEKRKAALERALDIRKFEIEHYWKRAAYFWTLIAAAFTAYGVVQVAANVHDRHHLAVLIGALGFVLSFAWFCVNRGSKRWQENWENHVDMLEDDVMGPLYKTIAGRPSLREQDEIEREQGGRGRIRRRVRHYVTGPSDFSVSKINQIVSLFVTALWVPMLWRAVRPLQWAAPIDWFTVAVLTASVSACVGIVTLGRTDAINYWFVVTQRTSRVFASEAPSKTTKPDITGDVAHLPIPNNPDQ